MRQVMVYPGEDGYWVAQCPSLPACISQGKTRAEALENIKEAIRLYLEVLTSEGGPIPEDRAELVPVAL
jgi:predicted RNase H-like HicB family nuclease